MKSSKNTIAAILWGAMSIFWIVLMLLIMSDNFSFINISDRDNGRKKKNSLVNIEVDDFVQGVEKMLDGIINSTDSGNWDINSNSYHGSKNDDTETQTYSFNAKEITALDGELVAESLEIMEGSGDKIEITIKCPSNYPLRIHAFKQGSTIKISAEQKKRISFHSECSVRITIPSDCRNLKCNLDNTSGKIYAAGLNFKSFDAENVSGSIQLSNITASTINAESVSGSVKIYNSRGKIETSSISGSTEINFQDKLENNITSSTVSGSIRINVPANADFSADYSTTSGGIHTKFACSGKKSGTISNGSGKYSMNLSTVSGSINVN